MPMYEGAAQPMGIANPRRLAERDVSAESRDGVLRQQREFRSNRPEQRANNQRAIAAAARKVRMKCRPPALVPASTATGVRRGSCGSTAMPWRKDELDDRQIRTPVLFLKQTNWLPPRRCRARQLGPPMASPSGGRRERLFVNARCQF